MLSPCSERAQISIAESKSLSGSLENLQLQAQFQHYRSKSYAKALQNQIQFSVEQTSESIASFRREERVNGSDMASPFHIIKVKSKKSNSVPTSAPSSPSRRSQSTLKSSTLPRSSALGIDHETEGSLTPKKTRTGTITSFFKRLSPKLKRSPSKSKEKPWIVIEFAQNDVDGASTDAVSVGSDHSFELALRSREERQKNSPKRSTSEPVNKFSLQSKLMAKKNYSGLLERDPSPPSEKSRQKVHEFQQTPSRLNICKHGKAPSTGEKWSSFKLSPKRMLQDITGKLDNKGLHYQTTMKEEEEKIEIQSNGQEMEKIPVSKEEISHKIASQPPTVILSKPQEPLPCSSGGGPDLLRKQKPCDSSSTHLEGDDQLKEQSGQLRLHRVRQPPRTLNILHKIVVSPQMEKVANKMASVESIGSCSLDIDATASESSGTAEEGHVSSISQQTLNSASGEISYDSVADFVPEQPCTTLQVPLPGKQLSSSTEKSDSEYSHSSQRQPSYVSISCSVSGYTSFSYYNSKAREGMRSRDNSPGRAMHGNSSDISSGKNSETAAATTTAGHMKFTERKLNNLNSTSAITLKTLDLSPEKRRNSDTYIQQESTRKEKLVVASSEGDGYVKTSKSLVQQRIERLFGPGALAQGFLIQAQPKKNACSPKNLDGNKTKHSCASMTSESVHSGDRTFVSTLSTTIHSSVPRNKVPPLYSNGGETSSLCQSSNLIKTSSQEKNGMVGLESASLLTKKKEVPFMNGHAHVRKEPNLQDIDETDKALIKDAINGSSIKSAAIMPVFSAQEKPEIVKDGHYFIQILDVEKQKIGKLIEEGEEKLASEHLSEESAGRFRAAIGKANLLLDQKFQQFRGLCEKNINQHPQEPFPTTSSDLEGFWDMVLIQINEIYESFREINLLDNGKCQKYQVSEVDGAATKNLQSMKSMNGVKPKRTVPKKTGSVSRSEKAEAAAKSREEARRQLAELKRKARSQLTNSQALEEKVEIFIPKGKD